MPVSANALAVLDRIEAIEMRSLEWGFTCGSLSEDEAFGLGDAVCEASDVTSTDGQDLVEELIDSKLIFEMASVGGEVRIRSRFAEMMRLLAANRQLFPNKPWQGAPSSSPTFGWTVGRGASPSAVACLLISLPSIRQSSAARRFVRICGVHLRPGRTCAWPDSRSAPRCGCQGRPTMAGRLSPQGLAAARRSRSIFRHDKDRRGDRQRPLGQGHRDLPADRIAQGPVRRSVSHGADDRSDARNAWPPTARHRGAVRQDTDPGDTPGTHRQKLGQAGREFRLPLDALHALRQRTRLARRGHCGGYRATCLRPTGLRRTDWRRPDRADTHPGCNAPPRTFCSPPPKFSISACPTSGCGACLVLDFRPRANLCSRSLMKCTLMRVRRAHRPR